MYHYYFSELFHNIHDELILEIFHSDFERSDHWSENLIFVTWAIDEFHELNILEKNLLAKFSIINTSSHCTNLEVSVVTILLSMGCSHWYVTSSVTKIFVKCKHRAANAAFLQEAKKLVLPYWLCQLLRACSR